MIIITFIAGLLTGIGTMCLCNAARDGDDRMRWDVLRVALKPVLTNARYAAGIADETHVVETPLTVGQLKAVLAAMEGERCAS